MTVVTADADEVQAAIEAELCTEHEEYLAAVSWSAYNKEAAPAEGESVENEEGAAAAAEAAPADESVEDEKDVFGNKKCRSLFWTAEEKEAQFAARFAVTVNYSLNTTMGWVKCYDLEGVEREARRRGGVKAYLQFVVDRVKAECAQIHGQSSLVPY